MIDYALILATKYAAQRWSITGNTYDGIDWLDASPKPTDSELAALWPHVQYETQYATIEQNRLAQYEKESDPIFFKWQRGDATEQEWKAAVDKVKAENPYPPAP